MSPEAQSGLLPPEPPLGSDLHATKEFLCGWGAAFINITVTYPIYKVIFRQMLHGVGVSRALRQLSGEGVWFLYRGMLPPLCQKTASLSLMFGLYEELRRPLSAWPTTAPYARAAAALLAGCAEAALAPFERVQTLLQDSSHHGRFRNSGHALRELRMRYGTAECFRGLTPILLRNGPANVLFFYLRDRAQPLSSSSSSTPSGPARSWYGRAARDFASGAVIGAFISTLFYPLNVLRVQMQSQLGGPFLSLRHVARHVYAERGLRHLYRGVHLNYTRAFLSWGVINMAYELLHGLLQ